MNENQKKILTFAEDSNLAIFDELQEVNLQLKKLVEKPTPEFPAFPAYPQQKEVVFPTIQKIECTNFPVQKETKIDFSTTNALLQKLLEKDTEICVTLKIE